jgi:16S rRNA pseudouridine516 synthase
MEVTIVQKIRVDKLISGMGFGSRKDISHWIKSGRITINGEKALSASQKIDIDLDQVKLDGERIVYQKYTYIMMNKPIGVVCSTDSKDTNVIDILEGRYKYINLFPAGRLDKDTEGFVLLTNDGKMAHNILSPKKHVKKKYYVEIDGTLKDEEKSKIENKIVLEDGDQCLPCFIEILENDEHACKLFITIEEGKYHQIKRMFKAVSREVVYLKRISIGEIILDANLEKGEYRELNPEELRVLPISND